ncbi:MAG TPA: LCP family protein [Candidatus Saccharimonadales bacterium]|nr:LCP family protein [Candidatus Saccharimonadales bacterium]
MFDILYGVVTHERKTHGKWRKNRASIDGILPSQGQIGVLHNNTYSPSSQAEASSLGDINNRADGFHAYRQSPGGLGGSALDASSASLNSEDEEIDALLDEPIELDENDYKGKKDRKHPKNRPVRAKKILKRTALVLLILILAGAGYLGVKFYLVQKHLFHGGGKAPVLASSCDGDVPVSQLSKEGDGRINILLLGIGGPGHDGPDLTDTIMVASIDPVTKKVDLLSIPRDLWVKIPHDGYQKINAAYPNGKEASSAKDENGQDKDGLKLLDQTLQPIIGINIHYHVVVDFTAFQQAVDAVGGVDVNVPEQLYDPTIAWENHYNSVIAQKGIQHFDGHKALLYAKSRETSSDFARAERQRLILVALKDKVFSAGTFANPVRISSLLDSLGNNVYTDFDSSTIKCLYSEVQKVPSSNIKSLDLVTPPNNLLTTDNIEGLSVVEPVDGLYDYDRIQSFVRNSLRDGFIARENAQVAVYNATNTAGLATQTADTLKSYGYNVKTVDNAPNSTNPANTTVVDLSKGIDKYTRHYLETRFGVIAQSKLPTGTGINPPLGTSFVIILGTDTASNNQ